MPEGPECHTIARRLSKLLSGKKLISLTIHGGRYKKHGPPVGFLEFVSRITNETIILNIEVKGKLLYWSFSNDFVLLNTLGMSGSWRHKSSKHCGFSIDYGNNQNIWFKDQRHFGTLKFIPSTDLDIKLKKIGPDILGRKLTQEYWINLCRKYQNWTLPKLIMNQNKISGVGNYLKCEILYASKISPHRKISQISSAQLVGVLKNMLMISRASLKAKGVSIRDYNLPDGSDGNFQFKLQVYNRKKDRGGNKVIKEKTDDKRTTHWVPELQK